MRKFLVFCAVILIGYCTFLIHLNGKILDRLNSNFTNITFGQDGFYDFKFIRARDAGFSLFGIKIELEEFESNSVLGMCKTVYDGPVEVGYNFFTSILSFKASNGATLLNLLEDKKLKLTGASNVGFKISAFDIYKIYKEPRFFESLNANKKPEEKDLVELANKIKGIRFNVKDVKICDESGQVLYDQTFGLMQLDFSSKEFLPGEDGKIRFANLDMKYATKHEVKLNKLVGLNAKKLKDKLNFSVKTGAMIEAKSLSLSNLKIPIDFFTLSVSLASSYSSNTDYLQDDMKMKLSVRLDFEKSPIVAMDSVGYGFIDFGNFKISYDKWNVKFLHDDQAELSKAVWDIDMVLNQKSFDRVALEKSFSVGSYDYFDLEMAKYFAAITPDLRQYGDIKISNKAKVSLDNLGNFDAKIETFNFSNDKYGIYVGGSVNSKPSAGLMIASKVTLQNYRNFADILSSYIYTLSSNVPATSGLPIPILKVDSNKFITFLESISDDKKLDNDLSFDVNIGAEDSKVGRIGLDEFIAKAVVLMQESEQ